jgi:hypothetical protein
MQTTDKTLKGLMEIKKSDNERTFNAKVALRFFYCISLGATPKEAFDAVLGAGAYDSTVESVYSLLRAEEHKGDNGAE